MSDTRPRYPITIYHLIILCVSYMAGDLFGRLLDNHILAKPTGWIPILTGILGVILFTRPMLWFVRWIINRARKNVSEHAKT